METNKCSGGGVTLSVKSAPYTATYSGQASITLYISAYNSSSAARQLTLILYEDGVAISSVQAYIGGSPTGINYVGIGLNTFIYNLKVGKVYTISYSGDAIIKGYSCTIVTTQ